MRLKLFFEEKSVEMARTKVNQSLANAERRRESFLHRRNRLSRERQDKENEVKIALARKSQARAERAQREAARCEAAARLRDERLRQISIRAKLHEVERRQRPTRSKMRQSRSRCWLAFLQCRAMRLCPHRHAYPNYASRSRCTAAPPTGRRCGGVDPGAGDARLRRHVAA